MLALKFVSSSVRGVSVLAKNQLGFTISSATAPSNNLLFNHVMVNTDFVQQNRSIAVHNTVNSAHVTTVGKKAQKITAALMEAELDLPIKPKKPVTPWVAFVRDRKDELMNQNRGITAAEIAQILAREWKDSDKSQYEREYNDRRQVYLKKVEEYENSLTDQHREYLAVKKDLVKENRALKSIRKTKPPKLPRTCTNLFTQKRWNDPDIQEQVKHRSATEVLRDLFKEYRELSPEEKEKYIAMQQKDRLRFKTEFSKWYESVKNDSSLSHAARDQANIMQAKFKALSYI